MRGGRSSVIPYFSAKWLKPQAEKCKLVSRVSGLGFTRQDANTQRRGGTRRGWVDESLSESQRIQVDTIAKALYTLKAYNSEGV